MSPNTHTTQTVLVTGASRGLGRALARELAERRWQLLIDARTSAALEEVRRELAAKTTVVALVGDVTDAAHRRELAQAASALGGLDAVVNNAGSLGPSPQPALLDYPLDVLADVYRANVVAPLGVLQAVRGALKPGARIINITSDAGLEPYAGWGGYGSSKAALEQLSAILAAEVPTWRVYTVDPGDMRTQMHQDAFPGEDISDRPLPDVSVPGLIALLEGDYPSGRYKARALHTPPVLETKAAPQADPSPQPQGAHETRVVLTVQHFAAAKQLLSDGLGLKTEEEWGDDEGHGALFDAGHATLELLDEAEAARVDRVEIGYVTHQPVRLALAIDDVLRASGATQQRGATALGAPTLTPWNHFNQRLELPEGLQLTLFQERVMEAE